MKGSPDLSALSLSEKVRLAFKKIQTEFGSYCKHGGTVEFVYKSPEHKLMAQVIRVALYDLNTKQHSQSARTYLNGSMWHAQLCDIDPDWIRLVIKRVGIKI